MGLLDAFKDKQFRDDVADNGMNFLRSASNAVAGNVTGPVDMLAWALRKAGVPVGDAPLGGSQWAKNAGLLNDVQHNSPSSLAGETMGLLAPIAMTAGAPKIAGGLLQMADNVSAPKTMNPQTGAIVWHGSPHKFDKFDASKIGTGEGAQAYGHGLYLAENPGVARDYRNKLSQNITTLDANFGDKSLYEAADTFGSTGYPLAIANRYFDLLKSGKTENQAKSQLLRQLSKRVEAAISPGDVKGAQEAIDFLKSGKAELSGSLYKVNLPDEHIAKMLDWDKPLSQQAPEVQKTLSDYSQLSGVGIDQSMTGQQIYDTFGASIAKRKGYTPSEYGKVSRQAADELRWGGIPGIRYLDGVSRGTGAGTSNFVVFPGNEGVLQILERNGQPIR